MSDLLDAAAAALGVPALLVQRAAAARAADTGMTVDEVLTAWAGGGELSAPAPAPDAEEAPPPITPPDEEAPAAAPPAAAPTAPAAPAPAAVTTGTAPLRPAPVVPSQVTPREAAWLPEVVTVPTAGIRERTNSAIPRWLTTLLLVAPLFALFAVGGSATGECGEATELTTDVVTGEIVNCDGSEFTGQGPGGGGSDFLALGEQIYMGGVVAGVNCSGCHGAGGQGGASFPALTGVLTTFGACTDHVEWVTLGSAGFTAAGRETYGDTGKPVTRGMPGFASTLSAEQVAAVASFERVRFGGGDPATVGVDCGLVTEEETPTDGEGETPSTTVPGA